MNLYQLSEPTKSQEIMLGIDLGTTNSLVTLASPKGVRLITDNSGHSIIPSVIAYVDGNAMIGYQAMAKESSTYSSKRVIASRSVEGLCIRSGNHDLDQAIRDSAEILRYLKKLAQLSEGLEVNRVVLTVPAHFNEHARNATRKAAEIAGLDVVRLLNEPTAAAVAHSLNARAAGNFLVYDLGGGTFDVSILKVYDGALRVVATGGDNNLGGDDFDDILASYLYSCAISSLKREQLLLAKRVKEHLSNHDDWSFEAAPGNLSANAIIGSGLVMKPKLDYVTRDEVEKLWDHLIKRSMAIAHRTIKDSGFSHDKIDEIILVGGGSRMPLVKNTLQEMFGNRPPLDSINPDEVVAIGAGIQARALLGYSDHLLLDVVPMSLCIETLGDEVEVIIPRNAPIPAIIGKMFTTSIDGQTTFKIQILQGEGKLVKECVSLGLFELDGITPMLAGQARLEITFIVDANGLLSVKAEERVTGISKDVDIRRIATSLDNKE